MSHPPLHACERVPDEEGGRAGGEGVEIAVATTTRRRDASAAPTLTNPPPEDAASGEREETEVGERASVPGVAMEE